MARAPRRGRGGRTSPRTLLLLSFLALALYAGGELLLLGRSEEGQMWRARMGLPVDERAVTRSISRTIRTTFNEFGIPPGAQLIQTGTDGRGPRVRWTAYLPGRASTLQLNARLTERLAEKHVSVLDAWEDTLAAPGSEVRMRIGAGRLVTHELVLQRRVDTAGARDLEPARLLLVVDAFGGAESDTLGKDFLELGVPLTGAVLPQMEGTKTWANRLFESRHDVLAQIPMEPQGYPKRDPGPGAVLVDMPSGQIQRVVKKHLADIPHAIGATSWQGTMALSDVQAMSAVMAELERADAFWLDARIVPNSVAADRAAQAGVITFRIDAILEAPGRRDAQVKAIGRMLEDAVALARRRGYAIVLAHPDRACLAVLEREVPKLRRSGVRFERVSTLLKPQAY
ncbi:MAG: divergent polysaccharide deacetylase family protein [Candidatus Eisenbacteria bacterium]